MSDPRKLPGATDSPTLAQAVDQLLTDWRPGLTAAVRDCIRKGGSAAVIRQRALDSGAGPASVTYAAVCAAIEAAEAELAAEAVALDAELVDLSEPPQAPPAERG
jgi:hypothetical protein